MTSPKFSSQISLGNIIQVAILLVALAGGWALTQSSVAGNTDRLTDHETRLRTLEQASSTMGADFRAMREALNDIKTQQQDNNRLLRQLLSQTSGGIRP